MEQMQANLLQRLLATRSRLKEFSSQKIAFQQAIINHEDLGAIFPNTVNVIQGKKGVHKSRLTEAICSCLLSKMPKQFIGFKRNLLDTMRVLYVDTERNINDQFPFALQKIKQHSGYQLTEHPFNLDYISLVDFKRYERYAALTTYIDVLYQQNQSHLVVILDVVTDCVEDFNSVRDSMKLVDYINQMVNTRNTTFLCVIHENPGMGEKARGHLGTELINKASQVMQIGFEKDGSGNDTNLIKLKFLHSRNTRRLEPVFLEYSEQINGLVLADAQTIQQTHSRRAEKAGTDELREFLKSALEQPVKKSDLYQNLKENFSCSEKTLDNRLCSLLSEGLILKNTKDRNIWYSLSA